MGEDGEQDAIHAGFVLEGAHGPGPSPNFTEASFDGVGRSYPPALVLGFVAETGEQLIEVVAQAGDGRRVTFLEAIGEATGCGPRRGLVAGIHDGVEASFDRGLVGLADLVEDVPDLVSPAALDQDVGESAVGRAASRPEPPSTQIMSSPSPVSPRWWRSVRKRSHSAALSLPARRKSMISFLPSGPSPSATRTGRRNE